MSTRRPQGGNLGEPSQAMRWAGLAIVAVLTLAVLILPIAAAYITKNPYYLVPSAGTIPLGFVWRRLAIFLYKREEDYKIEALKIALSQQKQGLKKLIP